MHMLSFKDASLCARYHLAIVALLPSIAIGAPDTSTYTLYRNSVTDASMRLHVASFDASEGAAYNRENCSQAQQLFSMQPGVKVQFWCEPGRFRNAVIDHIPGPGKQFTTGKPAERTCNRSASELARGGKEPSEINYTCPK